QGINIERLIASIFVFQHLLLSDLGRHCASYAASEGNFVCFIQIESIFFVVFNIYFFQFQYECLSHIYGFIVVTVCMGIKVLLLYIGFMGNLTEKVRELDDVSPAAVSVATIPVGERKHKAVSNGACRSGNNAALSSCADLFRIFCCKACFTTSSKLLSQDAVHITIRSYKTVSTFVQKRVTALLSLRTAKHDMNLTAYEDVMS
ncbi:hypothetical protein C0J52_28268, partial [Blattella germanica]